MLFLTLYIYPKNSSGSERLFVLREKISEPWIPTMALQIPVFFSGDWYEILQTTLLPHLRKSWGTLLSTASGLSDRKSDEHPCRPVENHPSQTSRSRPRPLSSTKVTPDINVWCDVGDLGQVIRSRVMVKGFLLMDDTGIYEWWLIEWNPLLVKKIWQEIAYVWSYVTC